MTINKLIQKYKVEKISGILNNNTPISTLNELAQALKRGVPLGMHGQEEVQWQKELKEVDDVLTASIAFYDMFLNNIMKKAAATLAYYYTTKVIENQYYPENIRKNAYCMRAVVVFKNISIFLKYSDTARKKYYNGPLSENQFFDLMLLSDVYSGWNNDLNSSIFNKSIKEQVPNVASNHPSFTKAEIVNKGQEASNAMYDLISFILKNSSFPIIP